MDPLARLLMNTYPLTRTMTGLLLGTPRHPCLLNKSRLYRKLDLDAAECLHYPLPTAGRSSSVNEASFADALSKLQPRGDPQCALPQSQPYWQAPQLTWQKVMKLLKRKRAADPGGWATELWMLSWDDQAQRDRLLTWLQRISAPTASPEIKHMLSLTQLVIISKSSGGTRPHPIDQSVQKDIPCRYCTSGRTGLACTYRR